MRNSIFILTGAIRSGKTTALTRLYTNYKGHVDGFLTPDEGGLRIFISLDTGMVIPFEVKHAFDDIIKIGKYNFLNSTFQTAKKQLSKLINSSAKYIVIDEIGKLEIENKGFEPELGVFLKQFLQENRGQILLLVIRDSLLDLAIEKYKLRNAQILSLNLLTEKFLKV